MSLLDVHRAALQRQRHAANLIGPGDLQVHYDDSEAALRWLEPEGRWVDLGSGAGFPGVVLAAMFPHLDVDLVDSRRKRCTFLEHVRLAAAVPEPRLRVLHQRVEDLPSDHYDGVVSRAFAPPTDVMVHAQRLLRPGGTLVLFLQEHTPVDPPPSFHVFHVEHYQVDGRQRRAVGLHWVPST